MSYFSNKAELDAITENQTDASQKTQIVDGSGNVIGATSNKLNVNASATDLDIRDLTATDVVTTLSSGGTIVTGSYDALNETSVSVDCTNYRSASVEITGTWVGTLTFMVSNDNSNWGSYIGITATGGAVSTRTTNDRVVFILQFKYFQVRATAWTSGTATITAFFHTESPGQHMGYQSISQVTPGTSASLLGKAIDGTVGGTDTGVASLAKRVTTPTTAMTPANGDYNVHALDDYGKMWTASEIFDTQAAKSAKVSPNRSLSIANPERLTGTSFSGTTRDANFWTDATNGTGAGITQANQAILQCGTDAAGYAVSSSVRKSRYVAGAANLFRGQVQMPVAGLANSIQRWGAFTVSTRVPQDGYFFEMVGTTLYLNYVNNNSTSPPVANRVAASAWTVPFTVDTNIHTYEIVWNNRSAWFYVDDVLRHTITGSTAPLTATNDLPINLQNISITSTTNFVLNVRAASIWRFGQFATAPTYYHVTGALTAQVLKVGAGVLHRVTINNPAAQAITLYDAVTAANTIGIITPMANTSPFTVEYGVPFNNGLAVTVAGTIDATIIYE